MTRTRYELQACIRNKAQPYCNIEYSLTNYIIISHLSDHIFRLQSGQAYVNHALKKRLIYVAFYC